MNKDTALRLALEAMKVNNNAWESLADSGDAGFWKAQEQGYYQLSEKAITAVEAALEAKDEPVAWSEDFDAMPFNTYCKAIVDWYSHSRDGDSFLEGRDVEVIVVKYESGKGEYDTVFIHEGNKQYAYTRCEVSKWKPLYAHPFKE